MNIGDGTPELRVSVVCFPYHTSKDTGRGHDRYIFELVDNLKRLTFDVKLQVIDQGFSRGLLSAGTKLLNLVSDLVPSRAHVYHAISPLGGAVAILFGKGPLVVTIHDLIPFHVTDYDYSWKYWYVRFCAQLCVRKSAAIIVPYAITKEEIVSRMQGDASKVFVVNYGVDHSTYYPRPALQRVARRVLYIGEVSRSKGVDVLINAFGLVKSRVPDAELLIGGKTNRDQPMLEELSRSLGVRDITFQGFIPENELATYYSTTTVMVFPSRYGFGLSVLEAMACGTPVVVAAALDAPEFVGEAGLLVEPDSAEALAHSIVRVLTEPLLRQQLSAKASARASGFSWSRMALETREIYEKAAARVPRPSAAEEQRTRLSEEPDFN